MNILFLEIAKITDGIHYLITTISTDKQKTRDFYAILYLGNIFSAFIILFLAFRTLYLYDFLEHTKESINLFLKTFFIQDNTIYANPDYFDKLNNLFIQTTLDSSLSFFPILKISFLIFGFTAFALFILNFIKSIKSRLIFSMIVSLILLYSIDKTLIIGYIIITIIIFWITIFYPLGNGGYIKSLSYISGALRLYALGNLNKIPLLKTWKKTKCFLVFISFIILIYSLNYVFGNSLSFIMILLICLSIFSLIWMNSSGDETVALFRKLLVYLFFIPTIVISNDSLNTPDIVRIISIFIAIFFSIDRVINTCRELKKKVEESDLMYIQKYYTVKDYEAIKLQNIKEDILNVLSEEKLIIQIMCYANTDDIQNAKKLIEYHSNNFLHSGYKAYVLLISLHLILEHEDNLDNALTIARTIKTINSQDNNSILIIDIDNLLAIILFLKQESPNEIIELLSNTSVLDDYCKYILHLSYIKIGDDTKASEIYQNIEDKENYTFGKIN